MKKIQLKVTPEELNQIADKLVAEMGLSWSNVSDSCSEASIFPEYDLKKIEAYNLAVDTIEVAIETLPLDVVDHLPAVSVDSSAVTIESPSSPEYNYIYSLGCSVTASTEYILDHNNFTAEEYIAA